MTEKEGREGQVVGEEAGGDELREEVGAGVGVWVGDDLGEDLESLQVFSGRIHRTSKRFPLRCWVFERIIY